MEDQKLILKEVKELKSLMAHLIGTAELPIKERFNVEALNKAAKEFQKLSIERGDWISDENISKCIRSAPYRAGAFIRQEFGFANYFKRGQTYYYNKKDLIALGQKLKDRNINLERYMELKEDKLKFEKYVATALQNKVEKQNGKAFKIPKELKDITTSPAKMPTPDIVRADLKNLEVEFFENQLGDYIEIYQGNYAMLKRIYHFQKYINPEKLKRVRKWIQNFNMANELIKEITKKKEIFMPVPEVELIRL